ncbi:MAG: type II secretion system protein [Dolichospermum sp. DEX189]|jgi:prepilin-type N-terminal cleavage/methylation domain-containing protein|uniref:Type II secretion system protein n=1 Tax=Aphanizomenon flos-aquae FACHB-1040 TaxID=2692887 RepID=A0ABR8BW13_APHFL|nr:type II secretion system protein [Aphanizomenon flos-aquae]MBD2279044.1 type II secretion system protein [Aphanizomenon flos-aquae FACHB-1040]MBO1070944.1 type II secretion system protein [Dolichospermum sp. DEX189]
MMKLFKRLSWEKNPQKSQQGFTLLEVLVAIVVITAFINVALMGLVTAALFKSKAKAYSNGITWIQADLEAVRDKAANLSILSANAAAQQKEVVLESAVGLANNDQVRIGTDSTTYTIQSISGNSLTLTANLAIAQSANAGVTAVSKCTATSANAGFAYYLQQDLQQGLPSSPFTKYIGGKAYTVTRSSEVKSSPFTATPRYEVLALSYTVTPQSNSNVKVASIYAEVIPSAFYQC